jgi:polyisoprenoid-binding protein YceI
MQRLLRNLWMVACLLSWSAAAADLRAAEKVFNLDAAQSKVRFTLEGSLHTVHGAFRLKRGEIRFDPETRQAGGAIVVDATSGESGNSSRDKRMHKGILQSDKFGEITFTPDRFEGTVAEAGDSEIELHGMFVIHGASHDLTLKVHLHAEGDRLNARTQFAIPYVDWGMKNPSTLFLRVSDKVTLELEAAGQVRTSLRETSTTRQSEAAPR